jgi:hypothetical protein
MLARAERDTARHEEAPPDRRGLLVGAPFRRRTSQVLVLEQVVLDEVVLDGVSSNPSMSQAAAPSARAAAPPSRDIFAVSVRFMCRSSSVRVLASVLSIVWDRPVRLPLSARPGFGSDVHRSNGRDATHVMPGSSLPQRAAARGAGTEAHQGDPGPGRPDSPSVDTPGRRVGTVASRAAARWVAVRRSGHSVMSPAPPRGCGWLPRSRPQERNARPRGSDRTLRPHPTPA